MSVVAASAIISQWNQLIPGMQQSSNDFYTAVDRFLAEQHLDGVKIERVTLYEGGLLSAKREYLQVRRKQHVFHICAAPFGKSFFVSWWLGEVRSGMWALLCTLPFIGRLFAFFADITKPLTYYRIDTALMFQAVTHDAVLEALDHVITMKGMRALTEAEKKPIMRDLFGQISGGMR
ncbi:MAG: hypothetical protein AB3X44_09760 [Leptothrix sp. (in: b-proteobacteria)]